MMKATDEWSKDRLGDHFYIYENTIFRYRLAGFGGLC